MQLSHKQDISIGLSLKRYSIWLGGLESLWLILKKDKREVAGYNQITVGK